MRVITTCLPLQPQLQWPAGSRQKLCLRPVFPLLTCVVSRRAIVAAAAGQSSASRQCVAPLQLCVAEALLPWRSAYAGTAQENWRQSRALDGEVWRHLPALRDSAVEAGGAWS